jgi:hypothetical protein
VWKLHFTCRNDTMRVEIALCIYKSHSCVLKSHFLCRNYTRACVHHTMSVKITLCVWTSHYACVHHSMHVNITLKSDFYTQSVVLTRMNVIKWVEITVVRIAITLCVWKLHSAYIKHNRACWIYTLLPEITLVRVVITVCVWTSRTMRVLFISHRYFSSFTNRVY